MISRKNNGYSIIEILVYLAIFSVLSITVINSFLIVMRSSSTTGVIVQISDNGQAALDRLALEIHQAQEVNVPQSTFDTSPGVLSLSSTDAVGNPITVRFLVENGALVVYHNDARIAALTNQNVSVSSLVFRHITTPHGEAVKIELILSSISKKIPTEANFYDTIVLRGAY